MMPDLAYHLVDVFTDRPFGGNPLAVCSDGRGLTAPLMQRIARELNLSETTFVLPPEDPAHDFRVRIFTPKVEMPMAGHPTIGTTWSLASQGRIERGRTRVVLEEGVGPVPVEIEWHGDRPARCTMDQPRPEWGPAFDDRDTLAAMLAVPQKAIVGPGVVVSCGVPYLIVELADLESIRAAVLRADVWARALEGFATNALLLFTRESETGAADAHMRMFAPGHGVPEDPATGSAAGPLACHLARAAGLAGRPLRFEQGFEMERPSWLHVEIVTTDGEITRVRVGGDCIAVGEGRLHAVRDATG
jgi:trans-2,3-dihydro-3-hydroxyanthranilate isomerase